MAWPPEDELLQILNEQNPWHALGKVPSALVRPVRRPFAEHIWKTLLQAPFHRYQLIIGPRRVGKTVAMYQTVQELITQGVKPTQLWWCHLAHPVLMRMDLDALVGLATRVCTATAQSPAYFFLDELTYARNWDTWLKSFYDEQRPLRILGTSSSTAALRQGRLESGVGRWEEQFLAPCLFTEYLSLRDKSASLRALPTLAETIEAAAQSITATTDLSRERQRFIFIGGFPELLMRQSRREPAQLSLFEAGGDQQSELASELFHSQRVLRDDAVQKALYIDIPQVFGVGEPLKLERLLYTLAGQMTGLVSFAKLSADVGLTTPTVEKYVSYFERSFLVFLLPNYAPREETVQRRGRKLYFVDGAVRNAALQRGIMPLENPSEMGVLLENVVAAHLFALAQQTHKDNLDRATKDVALIEKEFTTQAALDVMPQIWRNWKPASTAISGINFPSLTNSKRRRLPNSNGNSSIFAVPRATIRSASSLSGSSKFRPTVATHSRSIPTMAVVC